MELVEKLPASPLRQGCIARVSLDLQGVEQLARALSHRKVTRQRNNRAFGHHAAEQDAH